ncbi:adenosylcobinamide amidohydrolase [Antarcticimicrobium sediminis]|uniref:Adenosylcobinamide amidohydrolase n=1 Tax=Antarcticimicrobium sediminis TaxID=2546227 RepID=A0A4R5ET18_9RHOB|nr:adenosylcobinamide amidohydrolase [Antarcticimicrobium sediminis]TDE38041.1 adenosylcobinamide amidohydrolase [Antarcticimicrobium sediminis]
MRVTLDHPWLELDLGAEARVLSWSLTRPGFVTARRILWREVRNADLPEDLDVLGWFHGELAARGARDAVAMLTSRHLHAFETAEAEVEGIRAFCLATVGLSNAEHIGTRMDRTGTDWGTINIALYLDLPLNDAALLELLSIVTQARTVAVMEAGFDLPTGRATGTGTDCIAVAAPAGDTPFAGLHTPQGEAAGRAVHAAVRKGAEIWMRDVRRPD